jgi:hypothetical protein
MKHYHVYGLVSGSKFLGTFAAETAEEACDKASESDACRVGLCNQCADEIDNAEIVEIDAEEVKETNE